MGKKVSHFIVYLTVIVVDQITKFYVINSDLYYYKNTGISFGLFENNNQIAFGFALILTFILLFLYLKLENEYFLRNILIVVIAASCSNLLDRIIHKGVIDFIQLGIIPTFNIADFLISSGMILATLIFIQKNGKTKIHSTN